MLVFARSMKSNWKIKENSKTNILKGFGVVTSSILYGRGISSKSDADRYFNPEYSKNINDPELLDGMKEAVERVMLSRKNKEKVCVFGDYDADGVTSTAMLLDFFNQVGINCFEYIPDRNREGYGMNEKAIKYIEEQGANLIVTVDCGISNFKEVEFAKAQKIDVIVIDHHHVPEQIPAAVAVVNPKKGNDDYPERELAGVGVAFKLISAIAKKVEGYDQEQLKWFLDLVAIGTIADCVPLLGENRVLTKYGLVVLGKTKRVGLRQLFHVGRIDINEYTPPTSQQIGFQVAPRINAAGRMDHASIALNLLVCRKTEEAKARLLALELEEKNKYRQKVTQEITREVDLKMAQKKEKPPIIIESSEFWDLGVIGLAAGKVTEKYGRPTILFQEREDLFKGSGRSIEGINMIKIIEKQKDILNRFGGHAQALGLEVSKKNLGKLKSNLYEEFKKEVAKISDPKILIDCEIGFAEINSKLLSEISMMEPFGQGNKKPIFLSRRVVVEDHRIIGNGEKHLKLWLSDSSQTSLVLEAIGFGMAGELGFLRKGDKLNILYNLENDEWNGFRKIQGVLVDVEKL